MVDSPARISARMKKFQYPPSSLFEGPSSWCGGAGSEHWSPAGLGLTPSFAGSWAGHFLFFNLSFPFCKMLMVIAALEGTGRPECETCEEQRAHTGGWWADSPTLPLMSLFTSFFKKGMLACVKKLSRGQYKQVTAVRTEPGHPFQAG